MRSQELDNLFKKYINIIHKILNVFLDSLSYFPLLYNSFESKHVCKQYYLFVEFCDFFHIFISAALDSKSIKFQRIRNNVQLLCTFLDKVEYFQH